MTNPFDSLGIERNAGWEEVTGTFSCDQRGCFNKATVAQYNTEKKILKWVCGVGHECSIEGFLL